MNSLNESFKIFAEIASKSVEAFDRLCESLFKLQIDMYPHRRSLRLAAYGSPRVRKKNQKRYQRYLKKQSKNNSKGFDKEKEKWL